MCRRNRSKNSRTVSPKKEWSNKEKQSSPSPNKQAMAAMLDWFLPDSSIFSKMRLHGNIKWQPRMLVNLALFWAWSESKNLTDAFSEAIDCFHRMFCAFVPSTYQGFMKAISNWTPNLMRLLWPVLHDRMEEIGGQFWRIGGWVPIAFDGSRSTAPRAKANEQTFCAKNYGNGMTAKYRRKKSKGMRRKKNERNKAKPQEPQAWITLLWHMGLRLPWMWRLGPSNSSERAHVMEMIQEKGSFPRNTLFCGDAGFVGYPIWSSIREMGAHFLVRVGANVTLLSENADYRLIKNGLVLCWPKSMQSKQPPLRLRLVKFRIGKAAVYLLTSVLDPKKLSVKQMIRFYKMRWGIEVEFRGLKQTLDRAKLRCRNDQRLLAELHWSLMAMAVAELFALKEQLAMKKHTSRTTRCKSDPTRRSLANTIRAIRYCIRHPERIPDAGKDLLKSLREALTDDYLRKKPKRARYRPRNPDNKKLGPPKVRKITAEEKIRLREHHQKIAA